MLSKYILLNNTKDYRKQLFSLQIPFSLRFLLATEFVKSGEGGSAMDCSWLRRWTSMLTELLILPILAIPFEGTTNVDNRSPAADILGALHQIKRINAKMS